MWGSLFGGLSSSDHQAWFIFALVGFCTLLRGLKLSNQDNAGPVLLPCREPELKWLLGSGVSQARQHFLEAHGGAVGQVKVSG